MPFEKKAAVPLDIIEHTLAEKYAALEASFRDGALYNHRYSFPDWCDKFFKLPSETSAEYGDWKTSRLPPIRDIMDKLSVDSIAEMVTVMKGSQLFLTTMGMAWNFYCACCDPGPMGYIRKTDDSIKDYNNQKLKPTILANPCVVDILGKDKPNHYADSYDMKAFPGGFLALGPATTEFLSSSSLGRATADEEDRFPMSAGKEGSPIGLLIKRMTNFPGSTLFRISTPVLKELSTIEPGFLEGTQERCYLPCPYCNPKADIDDFTFYLQWDHFRWSDELDPITKNPLRTWVSCPRCAGQIDESMHKTWMLKNYIWMSEKSGNLEAVKPQKHHSYHFPSFYSPVGFFSWADAVADWFEYQRTKDLNKLQVIINTTFAETYSLQGADIDYNYLASKREVYSGKQNPFDVPLAALCLTCGVDIQEDRIEAETVAWGFSDESWSIDYVVLPGDTALVGDRRGFLPNKQPSVWRMLDEYLYKRWKHESGAMMPVEATMIDANFLAEIVHMFCLPREARRIYPVRGVYGWGKGMWKRHTRRHEKYKTIPYDAYVDELKQRVYAYLKLREHGPGFCHFPHKPVYDENYFKGLTCESKKIEYKNGRKKIGWVKPAGMRNEMIDCRNYAMVARLGYPVDLMARYKNGLLKYFPSAGTAKTIVRKPRQRIVHPGL